MAIPQSHFSHFTIHNFLPFTAFFPRSNSYFSAIFSPKYFVYWASFLKVVALAFFLVVKAKVLKILFWRVQGYRSCGYQIFINVLSWDLLNVFLIKCGYSCLFKLIRSFRRCPGCFWCFRVIFSNRILLQSLKFF